jgi:hypothetical protein
MTDNRGIIARGTSECPTVANFLLDVADNGTFRTCRDGEDIANGELSLLPRIDKGACVKALCSDEGFLPELVAVRITKDNTSEGSTATLTLLYETEEGEESAIEPTGQRHG